MMPLSAFHPYSPPGKKQDFTPLEIAMHPKNQRQGIGERLINFCEKAALENGFEEMRLKVNTDNLPAQEFYLKQDWGYIITNGSWKVAMYKKLEIAS